MFHVAHPGALYLHQGRQWRVERLDLDDHVAWLEPADDADEYTQTARGHRHLDHRGEDERVPCGAGVAHLGSVEVTNTILAYQRTAVVDERDDRDRAARPPAADAADPRVLVHDPEDVELTAAGVEPDQVLGAVHAAEHALIGLLPLFTICDRWDVGGVSMAIHPRTLEPTIFVYDGYPGGAGIAELAFAGLDAPRPRRRRARRGVPVRRGLPVVRAVAEVRELERVPRQGRGRRGCSHALAGATVPAD